jgi:diguanylate cyclase (GGDEF)-like protein
MLSLVYEDMDIDAIEERFVAIVSEMFSFDRVALFFVKHHKKVLQGKLCKGFVPGTISSIEIPISANYSFTRPLVTGFPLWGAKLESDAFTRQMGLTNYAVIPIVNQKRIACWRLKKCSATDCPAYGKQWLRCWLVPGTMCSDGTKFCGHNKMILCEECAAFKSHSTNAIEGILLIDDSLSQKEIDEKTITLLSVIAHAVGIAINNSKAYSHALREAIHDDLTGLHNRRYFNERLIDEVDRAKRYGNEISLLLCDVDFFKNINDTYGHPVGDEVLMMIGRILRSKLRKTDIIARYGGEEFAVILLNTDKDKSVEIAENLRQAIAEAVLPGQEAIRMTISFGVAAYGKDAQTFEGLINSADKALYHAKALGRNRVCA